MLASLRPLITLLWVPLLGDSHKAPHDTNQEECQTSARRTWPTLLDWDKGLVSALVKVQVFTAAE